MPSLKRPRIDVTIPADDDLVDLADINRALEEQAVSLLLELTMLREHLESQNGPYRNALLPSRH